MIAGLLICDHVNEEYRSEFGDYPDMFQSLFPEFEWKLYDAINGELPIDNDECEVYFATGSRFSAYDELDWIRQLEEFIRQLYIAEKRFIGVCFGHQVMGKAMGGVVRKSDQGWCIGVHQFDMIGKQEWMEPYSDQIQLLMMCQDQVVELPKGGIVLASSELCPIAILQLGDRFLGIQAHPEFSKEYDKLLMLNRIDRMGEKCVNDGIRRLDMSVDTHLIKDWITNFLK